MRPALVWVLGRGGFLGSRLPPLLARQTPAAACWDGAAPRFAWGNPPQLASQLKQAVAAFARAVRGYQSWVVAWVAGAGVIGTTEAALQAETGAWELLLQLLDQQLGRGGDRPPGLLFLTSSAGGAYGNCPDQPITEDSRCQPISAYGRNKLRQEALLRAWADSHPHDAFLIGRVSNLYGPGQNLAKPQGLIAHISRCLIYNRPVHIYVPLDTIRDYNYVDDCAGQIVCCLASWLHEPTPGPLSPRGGVKILAAEQTTAVAQIVGAFARIAKRHPKVINVPTPALHQSLFPMKWIDRMVLNCPPCNTTVLSALLQRIVVAPRPSPTTETDRPAARMSMRLEIIQSPAGMRITPPVALNSRTCVSNRSMKSSGMWQSP